MTIVDPERWRKLNLEAAASIIVEKGRNLYTETEIIEYLRRKGIFTTDFIDMDILIDYNFTPYQILSAKNLGERDGWTLYWVFLMYEDVSQGDMPVIGIPIIKSGPQVLCPRLDDWPLMPRFFGPDAVPGLVWIEMETGEPCPLVNGWPQPSSRHDGQARFSACEPFCYRLTLQAVDTISRELPDFPDLDILAYIVSQDEAASRREPWDEAALISACEEFFGDSIGDSHLHQRPDK